MSIPKNLQGQNKEGNNVFQNDVHEEGNIHEEGNVHMEGNGHREEGNVQPKPIVYNNIGPMNIGNMNMIGQGKEWDNKHINGEHKNLEEEQEEDLEEEQEDLEEEQEEEPEVKKESLEEIREKKELKRIKERFGEFRIKDRGRAAFDIFADIFSKEEINKTLKMFWFQNEENQAINIVMMNNPTKSFDKIVCDVPGIGIDYKNNLENRLLETIELTLQIHFAKNGEYTKIMGDIRTAWWDLKEDEKEDIVSHVYEIFANQKSLRPSIEEVYKKRDEHFDNCIRLHTQNDGQEYDKSIGRVAMKVAQGNGIDDREAARIYQAIKEDIPDEFFAMGKGKVNVDMNRINRYVDAAEQVFGRFLSYDPAIFEDLDEKSLKKNPNRYTEIADLIAIKPVAERMLKKYYVIKTRGMAQCALGEAEIENVMNRCDILSSVEKLFPGQQEVGQANANKKNEEVPGQQEVEQANVNKKNEEKERLKNRINGLRDPKKMEVTEAAKAALYEKEERERSARSNAVQESLRVKMQTDVPVYNLKLAPKALLIDRYGKKGKQRKPMTVSKREAEMAREGSELNKKVALSKKLALKANKARDLVAKGRRELSFSDRVGLSMEELHSVSAFFTKDVSQNAWLVRMFSGRMKGIGSKEATGEQKRSMKNDAMDFMTDAILNNAFDGADLSTDENLVKNATMLEENMLKVKAYRQLLISDKDYQEKLKATPVTGGADNETLYDRVMRQLDQLGTMVDYYRTRKLVLTDSYYLSHYDDEILNINDEAENATEEQQYLQKLMRKSSSAAHDFQSARMKRGSRWKSPAGTWFQSTLPGTLDELEEEHKGRALATGRFDMSLCTEKEMRNLMGEFMKCRERGINIFRLSADSPELERELRRYSPAFRSAIKRLINSNNQNAFHNYVEQMRPGLLQKIMNLKNGSGKNRIGKFDIHPSFVDSEGENYNYGPDHSRERAIAVQMAEGQMMSDEEVIELLENLQVDKFKDLDRTDAKQVEKAEETYFKSMAEYVKRLFGQQRRILKTNGFACAKMPPLAISLGMGAGGEQQSYNKFITNSTLDIFSTEGGKHLLKTLVKKGYLSEKYLNLAEDETILQSELNNISNAERDTFFCMISEPEEDIVFDSLLDEKRVDDIFSFRDSGIVNDQVSDKEELGLWTSFNRIMVENGLGTQEGQKRQCEIRQKKALESMRKKEGHSRFMRDLEMFRLRFDSVETGGHSDRYKNMERGLNDLRKMFSGILKKSPADGKNLSPEDMVKLRECYKDTIQLTEIYLSDKNRNHSNAFYRERYAIAQDMLDTMKSDYDVLMDKYVPERMEFETMIDREGQLVSLGFDDIKKEEDGDGQKYVFSMQVGKDKKEMLLPEELYKRVGGKNAERKVVEEDEKETTRKKKLAGIDNIRMRKRELAAFIVAKSIGTESKMPYHSYGTVKVTKKIDKKMQDTFESEASNLVENVKGLTYDALNRGIRDGSILLDNEGSLIEQMSDILVMDYICGNVGTSKDNVVFEMEKTGKLNAAKVPIRRIKRIICKNQEFSFGNLKAEAIKRNKGGLCIPEKMQLISRGTADRILRLKKDNIFYMLGATVNEKEKEAMWSRVEHMQNILLQTQTKGKGRGLKIVEKDGFDEYSLDNLSRVNADGENIYHWMNEAGKNVPVNGQEADDMPSLPLINEARIDVKAGTIVDPPEEEGPSFHSADSYFVYMLLSDHPDGNIADDLGEGNAKKQRTNIMERAAKEFDNSVGRLFKGAYDDGEEKLMLNRFATEKGKAYGIGSILDIFFIDGKQASSLLTNIDATVEALAGNKDRKVVKDNVIKAFLMAYLVSGKKQVTIANYQKNKKGEERLVIMDLNAVIYHEREGNYGLDENLKEQAHDDSKLITRSRKSREKRFENIRKVMERKRRSAH